MFVHIRVVRGGMIGSRQRWYAFWSIVVVLISLLSLSFLVAEVIPPCIFTCVPLLSSSCVVSIIIFAESILTESVLSACRAAHTCKVVLSESKLFFELYIFVHWFPFLFGLVVVCRICVGQSGPSFQSKVCMQAVAVARDMGRCCS